MVALFAFTLSPIFIRFSTLPASLNVAGRLLLTLFLLMPFWLASPKNRKGVLKNIRNEKIFFAGILMGLHFILWTMSLSFTSVSSASIAVCTSPIFTVLIERYYLRRKISRSIIWGLTLSFLGTVLLFANDLKTQSHGFLGIGFALLASFLYAIYLLIGEHVRQRERLISYVFPMYFIAMVVSLLMSHMQGGGPKALMQASGNDWLVLLALAVFPTILGHTSFNYLVRTISATTLSVISLVEPFLATLMAIPLLKEIPTVLGLLGGLISIGGIFVVLRFQAKPTV